MVKRTQVRTELHHVWPGLPDHWPGWSYIWPGCGCIKFGRDCLIVAWDCLIFFHQGHRGQQGHHEFKGHQFHQGRWSHQGYQRHKSHQGIMALAKLRLKSPQPNYKTNDTDDNNKGCFQRWRPLGGGLARTEVPSPSVRRVTRARVPQ